MESNKKVMLALSLFALIAVIALGAYVFSSQDTTNTPATSNSSSTNISNVSASNNTVNTTTKSITPPEATSDIDDSIESILTGVDAENSEAQQDGVTESALTSDSDALQSYGQSYDENEY